ncbi:MAG TPA: tRNA preQ1(34) S-adenosylmethionine ribosyltransferase-isomerase QueA, partial [Pseudobdellovibrionaceae bacterium]|nr:tRNA preQ1(34) S-adenosylmethionine ribosyltransferase-isomerase QueA [Pseudobdellovibrionaceae bacterium]
MNSNPIPFSDQDLQFEYPESLTATEPSTQPRVLINERKENQHTETLSSDSQNPENQNPENQNSENQNPENYEIQIKDLIEKFNPGDVLVLNETQVLKRRVFVERREILFIKEIKPQLWEVLFPVRGMSVDDSLNLPEGKIMTLVEKSKPQVVRISEALDEAYFERHGEVPLPPYIQKNRDQRHSRKEDDRWYQTVWARNKGSLAAPTAGLHFKEHHLERLREKGVLIQKMTLHVGLGTFLPIQGTLETHKMHKEYVEVPRSTWNEIIKAKQEGRRIWALGTTVTRSLESVFLGMLEKNEQGHYCGETDLFIKPGFEFKVVDVLMTNFHQPQSTLLALVFAFAGIENVKRAYSWAIEKKFRLFSYGDLSVWKKNDPDS